jgi:F0F1-type ATP synthase membrane subunit b/b'
VDLNPLNQINPVVIGAEMAIFTGMYMGLRRWFVLPYLKVIEERQARIEEGDAKAAEAERLLAEAAAQSEATLAGAHEKADRIVRESHEASDAERRRIVQAALDEVSAYLEEGRAEVTLARQQELEGQREEAIECVTVACGKLLGRPDGELAVEAVDRLLARRSH